MGFIKGFCEGLEGRDSGRYRVSGNVVHCPHCGYDRFELGEAQLNTAGLTFLDLDWLNRSATVLMCRRCGHLEWFNAEVEAL